MRIPFIKPIPANIDKFICFFNDSITAKQYTNFGPNEKKLNSTLSKLCGSKVILAANATLILDGMHFCLSSLGLTPLLPKWTFPATNLAIPAQSRVFGKTSLEPETLGFSFFSNATKANYAITTCPFGTEVPSQYIRPNVSYWIIDNAAGASPDMHVVNAWLSRGADAVIVSLHATKGLSACEGGFVAFGNNASNLYAIYKKYINFGFELNQDGTRSLMGIGSNHKMSEISAAWCLAKLDQFQHEYAVRTELAEKYLAASKEHNLEYIYSTQAFWIRVKSNIDFTRKSHLLGFDVRPYYAPILNGATSDENADTLAAQGICLPSWAMEKQEQNTSIELFKKGLESYLETT
jgi:hypothetical protein